MALLETIRDLEARAEDHRKNARQLETAIAGLRGTCTHDWRETGYDPRGSSTTFYECTLCGQERSE